MHDALTLWTIGHSNRPITELIAMLTQATIATLVDVRAQPHSARHPQFNEESLRESCGQANIVYHWAGRHLGGKRALHFDSPHIALDEDRRGFADHMGTEIFKKALSQFVSLATRAPTAMLCAARPRSLPSRAHCRLPHPARDAHRASYWPRRTPRSPVKPAGAARIGSTHLRPAGDRRTRLRQAFGLMRL